jgi:hypothetical protein
MDMPYKTLTELKKAIDTGEIQLNPEGGDCLIVEGDSTYFYLGDEIVFRMHPSDLLEEALNLLGIPWEHP